MLAPVLVTPPAEWPIGLHDFDGALAQARIDSCEEDGLIEAYIEAATAHLDGYSGVLGRCLVSQTWRQDFRCWSDRMRLPLDPVLSIESVTYYDADNTQQTLDPGDYALRTDALGPYLEAAPGATWPGICRRSDAVGVTFIAGYGGARDVPAPLRQAIRLLVAYWYATREAVNIGNITSELPFGVEAMIGPYRRVGV